LRFERAISREDMEYTPSFKLVREKDYKLEASGWFSSQQKDNLASSK